MMVRTSITAKIEEEDEYMICLLCDRNLILDRRIHYVNGTHICSDCMERVDVNSFKKIFYGTMKLKRAKEYIRAIEFGMRGGGGM